MHGACKEHHGGHQDLAGRGDWFQPREHGNGMGNIHGVNDRRKFRSQTSDNMARWSGGCELEMNNCTPLWHEAHFQVKMHKAHHCRTTFGSCDVEKSARRCGAKHVSKSKVLNWGYRTTFWRSDVEKVYAFVARSTFGSQTYQKLRGFELFLAFRCWKSIHLLT